MAGIKTSAATIAQHGASKTYEFAVAGFALLALLAVQWTLSSAIHGTNYDGGDGKMAQATILAAVKFTAPFQVTTLSPIQGIGSQLLPLNVWANPAYWPFHLLDKALASDVSALIALMIFASACYVMARCFDVGVIASAIAAQLCIVLFAPMVLVLKLPTVFCINPGNAVAYAPHMIALGLLARLELGIVAQDRPDHRRHICAAVLQPLLRSVVDHGRWHQLVRGICRRGAEPAAAQDDCAARWRARLLRHRAVPRRGAGISAHALPIHRARPIPRGGRSAAHGRIRFDRLHLPEHQIFLPRLRARLAARARSPARQAARALPGRGDDLPLLRGLWGSLSGCWKARRGCRRSRPMWSSACCRCISLQGSLATGLRCMLLRGSRVWRPSSLSCSQCTLSLRVDSLAHRAPSCNIFAVRA